MNFNQKEWTFETTEASGKGYVVFAPKDGASKMLSSEGIKFIKQILSENASEYIENIFEVPDAKEAVAILEKYEFSRGGNAQKLILELVRIDFFQSPCED